MSVQDKKIIEGGFPFEELSVIAEQESWRKEVNRPTSYIHKWWARRLGSVFRGLLIGGLEKDGIQLFDQYYSHATYRNKVVFDPFMGSGTTITEAVKLGVTAIGSDINPVAATIVRTALEKYDRDEVIATFNLIEKNCSDKIKKYYQASYDGNEVDVLYYFWVKVITCDDCSTEIPLLKSTIFSKNAYASKKPEAKSICPHCGHINQVLYNDEHTQCSKCREQYNPQAGNVKGIEYICPVCGKQERIIDYMRRRGTVPQEKMYAKMILDSTGNKKYVEIDEYDIYLYDEARRAVLTYGKFIPEDKIHEGINTNQILNYQYQYWREMFNSRQLLAFAILSEEIMKIQKFELRRLFTVLLSGTLEFNNMFCSFKGEGTGAVRPLFYNHILKNELMPLEANPWGSKASSGSFSTLFETRILRMLDYKQKPFELKIKENGKAEKVFLDGCVVQAKVTEKESDWCEGNAIILCKDSAKTNIPTESVDLVVTDPPFFDNVNYSELADFFYVWMKKMNVGVGDNKSDSTRVLGEVQDNQPDRFSSKLCDVFKESNRVLKREGILMFTYHHSRTEGWVSVYNAICGAGFIISQVIPIKAEMAVSVAIMASKEPINYDLVFVCRKKSEYDQMKLPIDISSEYSNVINRLEKSGLIFSEGDKMILQYGLTLKHLSERGMSIVSKEDIEEKVVIHK